VTIADLDPGDTEAATVTLSSTANGALSNFGGGSYNASTGVYTVSGGAAAVTAALDALVFTPLAHEVAPGQSVQTSFALSVTDSTMIDAATNVANVVAVNTPPAIEGLAPPFIPGYFTVGQTPFAGTTIVDPDVGATETVTITLPSGNGALSLAGPVQGISLTEQSPGVYQLSAGTPAAVTAALDAVVFTPSYNASGFTITGLGLAVSDGTATTTASTEVLAGAPVFNGTVANQPVTDIGTIAPFSTVTITDSPEFTNDTVTITVTDINNVATDANGFLAGKGLTHIGVGLYALLGGTPSFITSELDALVFTPTEHQVAAGQSVTTNFVLSVSNGPSTSDNGTTSVVATATAGNTYVLTTHADTVAGGANDDKIVAKPGTLSAGDNIDGGGGINSLVLTGHGTFDLRAPASLASIQLVDAQEGQAASGTIKSTTQTVYLRSGLNATINVEAALINAANPIAPTITIVGVAGDASTINLASGNDVVTVGSTAETVNGGYGIDTIKVTASTIGATIDGGSSGKSVLFVSGGGTMAMGASITNIATVDLAKGAVAYNFTANGIAGLTVDDLNTGADTIAAAGLGQVLTGGTAGKLTMDGFAGGGTTFRDTSALINKDTIGNFAAAGDVINLTDMVAGSVTGTFTENAAGTAGSLHVTDGTHTATTPLVGQFAAAGFSGSLAGAGFVVAADSVSGTDLTHP
jgi:plastocyanin